MKRIALLIMIVFFVSCNENKSENTKNSQPTEIIKEPEKQLSVIFSFKTNQSDIFRIMMNNISVDEFQKKNVIIFEEVTPTSDYDNIKATFEKDNLSGNLIINLGSNTEKEVIINEILFSHGDKSILVNKKNFSKYISYNKFIERDSLQDKFIVKKIQGMAFNPVIFINQNLINELKN